MNISLMVISTIWLIIGTTKSSPLPELSRITSKGIEQNDLEEFCNNQNVQLNFSKINFPSINDDFVKSPIVTCLILHNIHNEKLSTAAFDKLPNLEFLDLSNNIWRRQQILHKSGHEKLKSLVMNDVFERNPKGIFINSSFPALEKLYLKNNFLKYLSGGPNTNLPKLTHLFLNNNQIERILFFDEYDVDDHNHVIYNTNRYNNNFTWLPKSLKHIDLDNNKLDALNFVNLNNLEFLTVKNNKLETVSLQNLAELRYLCLDNNNLESIFMSMFYDIPKLEELKLSNNKIIYFDGRILDYTPLLQTLILDFNSLNIAPEIHHAFNLKNYSIRHNKIEQLTNGNFNHMTQLQDLRLDNNKIVEIESGTFNQLEDLEVLSLGRNNLTNLPKEWMTKMQKLQFLYLEENKFTNLEALELSDSPTLSKLFLYNNPLMYLRFHSLDSVPENITIFLIHSEF